MRRFILWGLIGPLFLVQIAPWAGVDHAPEPWTTPQHQSQAAWRVSTADGVDWAPGKSGEVKSLLDRLKAEEGLVASGQVAAPHDEWRLAFLPTAIRPVSAVRPQPLHLLI